MIARATPKTGARRRRLLYVEDDAESLALVEGLLAGRKDLQLLRAADTDLGIERSRSERPDVILINIDLPGPGSVFLHVDWSFRAPVRPGDEITAEVEVTAVRDDKPVTNLTTVITNQDGVVVLEGTAVVWRDPSVAEG